MPTKAIKKKSAKKAVQKKPAARKKSSSTKGKASLARKKSTHEDKKVLQSTTPQNASFESVTTVDLFENSKSGLGAFSSRDVFQKFTGVGDDEAALENTSYASGNFHVGPYGFLKETEEKEEALKREQELRKMQEKAQAEKDQALFASDEPQENITEEPIRAMEEIEELEESMEEIDEPISPFETEKPAVITFKKETGPVEYAAPYEQKTPRLEQANNLFIVKMLHVLVWPFQKVFHWIYWPVKLRSLDNGKRYYDKKYKQTEDVEDIFARSEEIEFGQLAIPRNWAKILVSFIILSVILVFPLHIAVYSQYLGEVKQDILHSTDLAFSSLQSGREEITALSLDGAVQNFTMAKEYFLRAGNEFEKINLVTRNVLLAMPKEKKTVETGLSLVSAGAVLADVGKNISESVDYFVTHNIASPDEREGFLNVLAGLSESINIALPKVALAQTNIESYDIDENLLGTGESVAMVQNILPTLKETLLDVSALVDGVLNVLGHDQWRRYLVVFENNNELRATGGFMGSYALVDIDEGKIKNIELPAGGSYDLQGSLLALVSSPEPLHLINPIWEFQDSNWWPDFPTSAQKISWFYEQAKGPSVDGVIVITASLMERIIEVVGPIAMPEYEVAITSENFTQVTQNIVESEDSRATNRPKQFLADLAPKLLEEIPKLDKEQLALLGQVFHQGFREKQIMLYSFDPLVQNIIEGLDWGGAMKTSPENSDYISVINTNIAGQKSDEVMSEIIDQKARIDKQGQIINTLTIRRTHRGDPDEPLSGVPNNSYMRIYVPQGSSLLSAEGFDRLDKDLFEKTPEGYSVDEDLKAVEGIHIYNEAFGVDTYKELDKTVFAGWLLVKPGQEKSASITYSLPFEIDNAYSIIAQKQAGTPGSEYHLTVETQGFAVQRIYPETFNITNNAVEFHDLLTTDKFYGIIFE